MSNLKNKLCGLTIVLLEVISGAISIIFFIPGSTLLPLYFFPKPWGVVVSAVLGLISFHGIYQFAKRRWNRMRQHRKLCNPGLRYYNELEKDSPENIWKIRQGDFT